MTKRRIYIAGPMRGIKLFNFPAFDAARDRLAGECWECFSPADLDRQAGFDPGDLPDDYDWQDLDAIDFDLREAARRDLAVLTTCDAIFMLDGFKASNGAMAELSVASWLGLRVYCERDWDLIDEYDDTEQLLPVTQSTRESVLQEAIRITQGDRQASYGTPADDFARTAAMWSAIKGVEFTAREVAAFMICVKLSRQTHQNKRDNWVDIAGYAGCGSECE